MLRFENISKNYKNTNVLKDISFQVNTGELVSIIGPSGCGKTTLLKIINKLIVQTSGNIYIDDTNIKDIDATTLRRSMGYVIQQTGLFIHMTIGENIGIIPKLQGKSKEDVKKTVDDLLKMVGLDPEIYYNRFPSQLSGGQLQRVGVARAFATNPEIILMDEPFSALDPITRLQLQDELIDLHQKLGKTIIFVTHDINEAIKISDRICILHKGNVDQYDTPENILLHPANDYVEDFIGPNRVWSFPQYLTTKNIMNTNFITCYPDSLLNEYSKTEIIGNLFVINKSRELLGIISKESLAENNNSIAKDIMNKNFLSFDVYEKVNKAMLKAEEKNQLQTPITENNKLVGTISQSSLAEALFTHIDSESDGGKL